MLIKILIFLAIFGIVMSVVVRNSTLVFHFLLYILLVYIFMLLNMYYIFWIDDENDEDDED